MSELLPHEIGFLERAVSRGETENTQASIDMTSAIDDPNSWHDNAAYDEVIGRMTLIDARYAPVLRILREAEVIEYPDMDEEAVAIGSLVNIELNTDPLWLVLVGQSQEGVEDYQRQWRTISEDELFVITSSSPLGSAVLHRKTGETSSYTINGQQMSL